MKISGLSWSTLAVILVVCHMTSSAPSERVKRGDIELSLDPVNVASSASAHGVGSASRGSINALSPTRPPIKTTTDDTPDFDRSKVSLEIPDKLFGSSFTTVTNISKIIGDLMSSTARRSAQFLWVFKPLFGNALKIEIPEPTTTEASK